MADNRNQNRRSAGSQNAQRRPLSEAERRRRAARAAAAKKRKRRKLFARILVIILIIALVVVGVLVLVNGGKGGAPKPDAATQKAQTGEDLTAEDASDGETAEDAAAAKETTISLIAVGDVIGHDTILELANTGTGYDFRSLFAPLKEDIKSADIAVVNMETPFGGEDVGPFIGYPAFNTPEEMGLALIDSGFDVVQLASNHSMDSGTDGLLHELDFWSHHKDEVTTIGVNDSPEAKEEIPIVEKDGIRIAFLNYTYGLNGYELPEEYSYMLTLLTDENADFIRSQIEAADQAADLVVVCPHWGTEYQLKVPDASQESWAELFTEAGADVIIGTHPHVVERAEWIEAGGKEALCYYSLGNYVSNQQETETVLGAMAYLEIENGADGAKVVKDSAKVIPLVTHNDKTGDPVKIATYYLADYTDDMAEVHDTKLSFDPEFSVAKLQGIIEDVFGQDWLKERIR